MINKKQAEATGVRVIDSNETLANGAAMTIAQLKQLLPNVINSDNQLDMRALNDVLDIANTTSNNQGYELTFAGKGIARAEADSPTNLELKTELAQSKNFDETDNVVIRGDNIDVLKILYQNYHNKIKMIYIDPPYNTQSDNFVYNDNFKQNEEKLIEHFGMNEETSNFLHNVYGTRSHSGWLSFMYPRLKLARDLLADDGVILVHIDYNESHSLKLIMDEIFGQHNFKEEIIWEYRTSGMPTKNNCFGKKHDTIFAYSRISENYAFNKTLKGKNFCEKDSYGCKQDEYEKYYTSVNIRDVIGGEMDILEGEQETKINLKPLINISKERIYGFASQKPSVLIKFLAKFYLIDNDIILDFFAGSGTTGDAIMQLNAEDDGKRKFVLVQWDEEIDKKTSAEAHKFFTDKKFEPVISSITIERLNRAGEKVEKEYIAKHGEMRRDYAPDIGYKVFSITDKPQVSEEDVKKGGKLFSVNNQRASVLDTLYNMLAATCKPLHTPIETLKKDVLYQADNELYLLANIEYEKLSEYADKKINLDGWADIDLKQFLNLDVPNKENITVIY